VSADLVCLHNSWFRNKRAQASDKARGAGGRRLGGEVLLRVWAKRWLTLSSKRDACQAGNIPRSTEHAKQQVHLQGKLEESGAEIEKGTRWGCEHGGDVSAVGVYMRWRCEHGCACGGYQRH
jgi:hypothetical protein